MVMGRLDVDGFGRHGRPWLSVVMPTFNGERYVARALTSVAAQEDPGLEVVLVDDGSTDGTLGIARSFRDMLRLRIFEQEHGGNWVASTNRGLYAAEAAHVSFLHQDDEWLPGRAAAIRAALRRFGPQTLLLHPVWFIDARGRRVGTWRCPLSADTPLSKRDVVGALLVQNFVCIAGTVFPRSTACAVGGLDEDLWYTADWDLWLRLVKGVEAVVYIPTPLASFRLHPSTITSTWSSRLPEFRRQLETVLDRYLAEWVVGGTDPRRVEDAARFSVEVNVALAALSHGKPIQVVRLGRALAGLGIRGWRTYLRDSRLVERVVARLRARASGAFADRCQRG